MAGAVDNRQPRLPSACSIEVLHSCNMCSAAYQQESEYYEATLTGGCQASVGLNLKAGGAAQTLHTRNTL